MAENTNLVDRIPSRQNVNTVEVFRQEDFPAPVGSGPAVITLAPSTTYLIKGLITLSADTVISTTVNTVIQGINVEASGINGNVAAPMIENDGALGQRMQLKELTIENLSTDAAAENVRIVQNANTAGAAEITTCEFHRNPVRLHSGLGLLLDRVFFFTGSSLIQGGEGGTGGLNISINGVCSFNDGGVPTPGGLFRFEAGSITQTIGLISVVFIMAGAGTVGIAIDATPAFLDSFLFQAPIFISIGSPHTGIKMENPDDIIRALIEQTNFSVIAQGLPGGGIFALEPVKASTLSIPIVGGSNFPFGVGITGKGDGQDFPGGNMMVSSPNTENKIFLMDKLGNQEVTVAMTDDQGTGYVAAPSDVLTIEGGTFNETETTDAAATLLVTSVMGGGQILGVSILSGGSYSELPDNPVSVSGGSGVNATFDLTFADLPPLDEVIPPQNNVRGVTWHKGDMYSCDSTGGGGGSFVYQHVGFSDVIDPDSPLTPIPGGNISDIAFVGDNLVTVSQANSIVNVFEGFSLTLLATFTTGFTETGGMAYDGVNLIFSDNQSTQIAVMRGVSDEVQYIFDATASDARGISCIPGGGFLVVDLTNDAVDIYDHGVTLDHTSKTWEIEGSPNVTLSSDRGGSQFFVEDEITVDLSAVPVGDWTDIVGEDTSTNIAYYAPFGQMEKCFLTNEVNGQLQWTGIRDRARILNAQCTFGRSNTSMPARIYQIAICIDGVPIPDSFSTAVLAAGSIGQTVYTVSSLPISRDLVEGQTVRIQIRNVTDQLDPVVTSSRISIT